MENNKRPENMERITTAALAEAFIEEQVAAVRAQVGDKTVSYTHLAYFLQQIY